MSDIGKIDFSTSEVLKDKKDKKRYRIYWKHRSINRKVTHVMAPIKNGSLQVIGWHYCNDSQLINIQ